MLARFGRAVSRPAVAILLLAPFFGEGLSAATPPFDLLLPWNLAFLAGLYGCGALICREVQFRLGLGLLGLFLVGAAYGVYEEGLVDRYWFYPKFWSDTGVGSYSEVWDANLLLATHLTLFHAVVSISASILIVERLFPGRRHTPWASRRGLIAAAVALFLVVPALYGEFDRGPGFWQLAACGALVVLLVGCAVLSPRRPVSDARPSPAAASVPSRHRIALIAFLATASHFLLVYTVPEMGIPWPIGIALTLTPVVAGFFVISRVATGGPYGIDALRVITGVIWWFILLDAFVGLGGRVDLIAGAIGTALALRWLNKRERRLSSPVPGEGSGIPSIPAP